MIGTEASDLQVSLQHSSLRSISFDGCGEAGATSDLAIENGCIVGIGRNFSGQAKKTIDATNIAVAPGFIDIKTHSDFTLPSNPKARARCARA